ncbi:hypothetical protein [Methylobacterium sp. Leaf117]|uniref:hypothetical protein n=1 Tax=Methylobacterium sp. Leaf117 TaxID=1736260 RepID=UPI000AE582C4|nr:hypothetical protein [Methylobacterium sp. Leaf117]
MSTRIATAVAALVMSVGAVASPALAQSYTAPAGIPAAAAPGGFQNTRSYDDITTGSISTARGGQLSVRLPELRTDDGYTPGAARHYGPRGEPLAY